MARIYDKQLTEVNAYLNRSNRRETLVKFQKEVKDSLLRALKSPSFNSLVSSVTSRQDTDPDNRIKSDKKIALKLYKWLKDPTYTKDPKPNDIHDIAGVTIICGYPSDTDIIQSFLSNDFKSKFFNITNFRFLDPVDSGGYRAHHGIAKGTGIYQGLSCEVQIKTQLTLSWGSKTHDLTYKPAGDIDIRLRAYMDKLTSIAQILDEQSEILRDLISEAWIFDEKRRNVARIELIKGISETNDPKIKEILKYFNTNKLDLSVDHPNEQKPRELEKKIDNYIKNLGHNQDICRFAVLYAVGRLYSDLSDWALEIVDDWIFTLKNQEDEISKAMIFRSLAAMSLGEYEESIETGRATLKRANKSKNRRFIRLALSNLAYFLSESFYHRAFDEPTGGGELDCSATEKCGKEALRLAKKLTSNFAESLNTKNKDTIGAVFIACGNSEAEIRRGLDYCLDALNEVKGTEAEKMQSAFHSLHEMRAFRRLLSIM